MVDSAIYYSLIWTSAQFWLEDPSGRAWSKTGNKMSSNQSALVPSVLCALPNIAGNTASLIQSKLRRCHSGTVWGVTSWLMTPAARSLPLCSKHTYVDSGFNIRHWWLLCITFGYHCKSHKDTASSAVDQTMKYHDPAHKLWDLLASLLFAFVLDIYCLFQTNKEFFHSCHLLIPDVCHWSGYHNQVKWHPPNCLHVCTNMMGAHLP